MGGVRRGPTREGGGSEPVERRAPKVATLPHVLQLGIVRCPPQPRGAGGGGRQARNAQGTGAGTQATQSMQGQARNKTKQNKNKEKIKISWCSAWDGAALWREGEEVWQEERGSGVCFPQGQVAHCWLAGHHAPLIPNPRVE